MKTVRKMMPIGERETVLEGCMRTEKSFSQREHEATLESERLQLWQSPLVRGWACVPVTINLKTKVHTEARKRGEIQIAVKRDAPFPNSESLRLRATISFSLNFGVLTQ
jgi:hypothetical protein